MTYQPSPQGWSSDNISCVSNLSLGHRLQGMRQGNLWSSFVFQVKLTCETKCLLLPLPPISQIISPKAPTLRESSFTFFGGTWLALEKLEGAWTMNINFAVYCRQIYMVSLWCSLEVWPQSISVVTKLNTLCLQLRIFGPEKIPWTRMHSSRMRTGRSLTVCCSLLPGGGGGWSASGGVSAPGGGCLVQGGLPPWGVPGLGGCLLWGVCLPGGSAPGGGVGIPACTEADTLPPPPVDRHTLVKILPWPNFVAAGNKSKDFSAEWSFPYKQYLLQFWYFWSAEWRHGGHAHRIQIINQRMVVKWGGFILVLFVTLTVRNLVLKMIIAPADVWLLCLFVCNSLYWSFW